jgi:hypothetical protein
MSLLPRRPRAYPRPVDSRDLTPEQVEKLKATVGRQLRFLNRLVARMQQRQFSVEETRSGFTLALAVDWDEEHQRWAQFRDGQLVSMSAT